MWSAGDSSVVPESSCITNCIWNGVFPQQVSVYLPPGYATHGASQVVLVVKNLPANAADTRDWVQSLGWEDPL